MFFFFSRGVGTRGEKYLSEQRREKKTPPKLHPIVSLRAKIGAKPDWWKTSHSVAGPYLLFVLMKGLWSSETKLI